MTDGLRHNVTRADLLFCVRFMIVAAVVVSAVPLTVLLARAFL